MANPADYDREMQRLQALYEREEAARAKAHDMHGGDHPSPTEPEMPTIITQFGEWAVTPFGIECLVYPYTIQWDSIVDPVISDDFWLEKLANKAWVNLRDFAEALHHGRQIHRYLQHLPDDQAQE